ncbi:MAG: 4-amino-4-deoxychorismate lyase [Planctomycetes bacterium]|jgi:branched-chain amino acid aminotransferase|nr:4-amino-4-deoxychorismate lyase [Planctomycetota bacterium]MDP6409093.1 aminotransferase class IV [Planctomycetota bacterium]
MPELPAWVDGRLVSPGEPALRVDDCGFTLGLAVFETLLAEEGCRYFEADHLTRLRRGAAALEIPWPARDPARDLAEFASVLDDPTPLALRLTLSRGAPGAGTSLVISARAVEPLPAAGVSVTVAGAKLAAGRTEGIKTTGRARNVLEREAAARQGAWEALLCTEEGDLSEGTVSNLFCVREGVVRTPPLTRGCLPGIVRGRLAEMLHAEGPRLVEERLYPVDLARADEVFLTNSTGRLVGVVEVRDIAAHLPGNAGPALADLQRRWRAMEERYRTLMCGE